MARTLRKPKVHDFDILRPGWCPNSGAMLRKKILLNKIIVFWVFWAILGATLVSLSHVLRHFFHILTIYNIYIRHIHVLESHLNQRKKFNFFGSIPAVHG